MRLPGKVVIDASPLRHRQAGIGYYTAQLIDALGRAGIGENLQPHDFGLGRGRVDARVREWVHRFLGDERYLQLREWMFRRHYAAVSSDRKPRIYHATNNIPPIDVEVPLITTVYDLSVFRFPEQHPDYRVRYFRQFFYRTLRSDRIVTVSQYTRQDLLERFPRLESRVTAVYPGLNGFYRLLPAGAGAATARRFTRKPFLLCIGSIEPRKNIEGLLRAFQIVRQQHDVSLLISGGLAWKYEPILELRERLNLTDAVFTGYLSELELRDLYNETELFVYPSTFEGFGFPPLEAMACGAPVAMSNVSSLPEVGGDAAAYFDPQYPEDMAAIIDALLSSPERRAEMAAAGLVQARRFSWEETATNMLGLYMETFAELGGAAGAGENGPVKPW